jgi:hypothetical protein
MRDMHIAYISLVYANNLMYCNTILLMKSTDSIGSPRVQNGLGLKKSKLDLHESILSIISLNLGCFESPGFFFFLTAWLLFY